MSRKNLLLLVCIFCSIYAVAQTNYYYDSYHGKKIPLTLNENKVLVSISKEYDKYDMVSERIRANVQALYYSEGIEFFEFIFITWTDLEKLTSLDFWEEDAKSVIITPCYYKEYGMVGVERSEINQEYFLSPYLWVKLKKEEDIDLLTSYAEKYKLKIDGNNPYYPLVYNLRVTQESEKNALECANEMYESGNFDVSEPDWIRPRSATNDLTTIQSVTTAIPDASSEIYDLQGRRLSAIPQKGVYIQNGKKKLVK